MRVSLARDAISPFAMVRPVTNHLFVLERVLASVRTNVNASADTLERNASSQFAMTSQVMIQRFAQVRADV